MKSNSNNYYNNKTSKFVKDWEAKRTNKPLYAFKAAIGYATPFSLIFILWEYGFTENFIYKLPLFFFITFSLYFLFSFFISFNFKESNYQKYKKEGF